MGIKFGGVWLPGLPPFLPDCHMLSQHGLAGTGWYLASLLGEPFPANFQPSLCSLLPSPPYPPSVFTSLRSQGLEEEQVGFGGFWNASVEGMGRTLSPGISPEGGWGLRISHCLTLASNSIGFSRGAWRFLHAKWVPLPREATLRAFGDSFHGSFLLLRGWLWRHMCLLRSCPLLLKLSSL